MKVNEKVIRRIFCFFEQKTAYEMRISDWSSDVCSSDLQRIGAPERRDRVVIERLGAERVVVIAGRIHPERRETDRALAERGPEEARIIGGIAQFSSAARRVGKECVRTCRSRWSP